MKGAIYLNSTKVNGTPLYTLHPLPYSGKVNGTISTPSP